MVKERQGMNHDRILFAVLGMSPSVLTETIWALAAENPLLVPNHVVVLTTSAGRAALEKQLFKGDEQSPCGWERLKQALVQRGIDLGECLKFGLASDHIRLFPAPAGTCDLADIATSYDNQAAADFMQRRSCRTADGHRTCATSSLLHPK